MKPLPPLLTPKELADYLHVSKATVYRMLKSNQCPGAFRFGIGAWRINSETFTEWLEEIAASGTPPVNGRPKRKGDR